MVGHFTQVSTPLRAAVLLGTSIALVVSCGGESLRRSDDTGDGGSLSGGTESGGATTGGTAAGGASTGGTAFGGAGGTPSTGGTSGSGGDDCSNVPPDGYVGKCIGDCSYDPDDFVWPVCAGNRYVCPTGSMPIRDCHPESCARRYDSECCRTANGAVNPMRCSADGGGTLPCEPGSVQHERGASCIPDGIDVNDCVELEGRPCTDTTIQCRQGTGCGTTTCSCVIIPDAGWRWSCQSLACVE
ncbi:MAG TPA: hypothetical protein VMS65_08370 [Polyangiaceae bacterium]|nr:hypothetical protein [Polyangiaceae bacterium]